MKKDQQTSKHHSNTRQKINHVNLLQQQKKSSAKQHYIPDVINKTKHKELV